VQFILNRRKRPRGTIGLAEHAGRLLIPNNLLGTGIPAQLLAIEPHRDISQVANRDRAMRNLGRGGRRLA
jgi:hypothetical protein